MIRRALRKTRPLATAFALTAIFLALAPAAGAEPRYSLQPVSRSHYFIASAQPGQVLHLKARLVNSGPSAGQVRVYLVDGTTGPTSGAVYQDRAVHPNDVGAWATSSITTTSIAPGQTKLVTITVRVPAGARPGDHLGGIVAEGAEHGKPAARHGGARFQINVRTLTVVAIEVQVPGARTDQLAIRGAQGGGLPGQQQVLLKLANTGNTLVKGNGTLVVSDTAGRKLKDARYPLDTFVPSTQIDLPVSIRGSALGPGNYLGRVTLHFAGKTVQRNVPFTITQKNLTQTFGRNATTLDKHGSGSSLVPILAAVIGLLLVALAVGGGLMLRSSRRTRRERESRVEELERKLAESESGAPIHAGEPD